MSGIAKALVSIVSRASTLDAPAIEATFCMVDYGEYWHVLSPLLSALMQFQVFYRDSNAQDLVSWLATRSNEYQMHCRSATARIVTGEYHADRTQRWQLTDQVLIDSGSVACDPTRFALPLAVPRAQHGMSSLCFSSTLRANEPFAARVPRRPSTASGGGCSLRDVGQPRSACVGATSDGAFS